MKRFMMGSRLRGNDRTRSGKDNKKMLSFLILLFSVGVVHAQQTPPPPPTIGWGFDEFHIGGEMLFYPSIGKDSFNMDFVYHYGGYPSMDYLTEPAPAGKADYSDRRNFRSMLLEAAANGMKVVYAPYNVFNFWPGQVANSLETYFDFRADTLSMTDFVQKSDSALSYVSGHQWIENRYVASVTVESSGSSTPDTFKIAGGPRFTAEGIVKGDGAFWADIHLPDSSTWHDVTATIKTNNDSLALVADNATIAYINVYRRVVKNDTGCPSCVCRFYTRIGYFPITKAMYVAAPVVDDKTFFKDLTFTIDLKDTIRSDSSNKKLWNQDLPGFNGEDTTCDALLARLKANNHVDSNTFRRYGEAEGSDVYYDIHTTRLVPITFLKGRVASHYFEYLNQPYRFNAAYRLDSSINHHLDQMMQDDTIWPMMAWMGTIDEPHLGTFQLHRILASKIQRRMLYNHPTDQSKWRGIWANTIGGTGTLRVLAGDFDSTSHKPMSVVITHPYPMSTALPSYYANKDSMNPATFEQYFNKYPYDTVDDKGNPTSLSGYGGATHFPSTPEAHALYTKYLVGVNPIDHGSWRDTSVGGLMLKMRINKADVIDCQFKFEHLGRPKIPVYHNIQMAGYLKYKEEGFPGFAGKWDFPGAQPRTPEQVTAQGWLTLNAGSQGMMVSDLHTTGPHLGIFTNYGTNPLIDTNPRISNDSLYKARIKDYDSLRLDDVREYFQRSVDSIPTIWLGYRQRFNAIKKITSAIKRLDTLYTKLQYNPAWQISVERSQDPPKSKLEGYPFSAMPLVDTAYTIQAKRFVRPDSLGRYSDSISASVAVADSIHHTYLEITHFIFKNQQRNATGERVLLLTNKRTWVTDWDHDSTNPYWDGNYGLGAIDVRLPVLRLKNTTGVVADSFIVERVGESYAWRDTGAFGQDLPLQWLEPGWGAMYRIIPLASGVSQFGTAFNNGVRSENPSTNATAKDRLVVYEREGNIFLRTNDSTGQWSVEHLISDLADTLRSNGTRSAVNINPTLATSRNSNALLVTWERKTVSSNQSRVRAAYFSSLPTRTSFPTPTYYNLSNSVSTSDSWKRLTPVVTGVPGGWLVAWAKCSGSYGIDLMAIRNPGSAPSTTTDFSAIQNAKALTIKAYASCTYPLDSIALFPTVAFAEGKYVCRYSFTSNAFNFRDTVVHLAYQQGTPDVANQQFIIYHQIGVDIPDTSIAPSVTVFRAEHVSENLPGCGFLHPSIAVDKKGEGIGVAFQANSLTKRQTVLRMRGNGVLYAGLCVTGPWNTTAYTWGGKDRWYEWPALTKFPKQTFAASDPRTGDGGLVWEWTNRTDQRTMQFFYRFGWPRPDSTTLPFGQDPTLTLAPYVTNNPFAYSSVFYRGDTATRFVRQTVASGVTSTLYPAALENTPAIRSKLFSTTPNNRNIRSEMIIKGPAVSDCIFPRFNMGIDHWWDIYVEHDGRIINDPRKPGLPPTFFPTDTTVPIDILTLSNASAITRTSTFKAGTTPVNVRWRAQGNTALVSWLDTQPYDSTLNRPADILLMMELVKASDSTVLWRSDTVTARDVDSDTLMEVIEVPVQAMAPLDTNVFIRLRAVATEDLEFDLSAGFSFVDGDSTSPLLWKVQRWFGEVGEEKTEAALQTAVIPNPTTTDNVEIRLQVQEPGTVRIGFYTMLGQQIATLPDIEIARAGVYLQEFDLSTMQPGIYLLVAEQGKHKASTKVTVIGR